MIGFNALRLYALLVLVTLPNSAAQQFTVTAQVERIQGPPPSKSQQPEVVVWLKPLRPSAEFPAPTAPQPQLSLVQKNKSFEPHLLAVQVGSMVDFPNRDPFFHNVFSLFDGKRFDLGLYEAGTTRHVRFDRPGVCYIFCNIHSEMSAVVVVLDTPYYGIPNGMGVIAIPDVRPGHYQLHVWDERSLPEVLSKLTREVVVSQERTSLGIIRIPETDLSVAHKNKYGRDYDKPVPSSPVYIQP